MQRFLSRLVLIPLALFFIFEAWLWEKLAPVVAGIVAVLPIRRVKAFLSTRIQNLSPWLSLLVFIVPAIPLFPLKLLGLWLLAKGQWFFAVGTIVFAKLVGVGISAFLFELTKPKLLQLPWFRSFYEVMLYLLVRAHALVDPIKVKLRRSIKLFAPKNAPRTMRLIWRIRRRIERSG